MLDFFDISTHIPNFLSSSKAAQTNPEIFRFLVDLEESLARSQNIRGQTPFHLLATCAPQAGADAIRVLVDPALGLDVNVQDVNGDSVLHCLCRSVAPSPSSPSFFLMIPLVALLFLSSCHFSANRIDLAQLLLHGAPASLSLPNNAGNTPLDLLVDSAALVSCVRYDPVKMKEESINKCQMCKETFGIKLRKVRRRRGGGRDVGLGLI